MFCIKYCKIILEEMQLEISIDTDTLHAFLGLLSEPKRKSEPFTKHAIWQKLKVSKLNEFNGSTLNGTNEMFSQHYKFTVIIETSI